MAPTPQMTDPNMPPAGGPMPPDAGTPEDVMAADSEAGAARMDNLGKSAPVLEEDVKVKDLESLAKAICDAIMKLTPADLEKDDVIAAIMQGIPEGEKVYSGPLPAGIFAALSVLDMLGAKFSESYDLRLAEVVNSAQIKRVQGQVVKMGKDKKLAKALEEAVPEAPQEVPAPPMGGGPVADEEAEFASV